MKFKKVYYIFFLLFSQIILSQNMDEGFQFLEKGLFQNAEVFFTDILKEYPDNKTAQLCYGRAIGLNGQPTKAMDVFKKLRADYPDDFEIKLNYAEALLWNKNFKDAKSFYEILIKENDQSFAATLGYANTLSNLKLYPEASKMIQKALEISPGNPNALVSKKYINLGYANQYVQEQKYDESIAILKNNLEIFKNDKETYLNLANTYLISEKYDDAKKTYENMALNKADSVIALNGISLVHHLKGQEKNALKISNLAILKSEQVQDTIIQNQTKERNIQALIWNQKYKLAKENISTLLQEKPNENWVLSLSATLNIYLSNFDKSITDYTSILKNDTGSFDGNLGKANALKASSLYLKAYKAAYTTLDFFDNQKDANNFIKTLNKSFTPSIESKTSYSFDNGKNNAISETLLLDFPLSTKLKITANFNYRTTENSITKNKATSNTLNVGLNYQLHPKILFKGSLGAVSTDANVSGYDQLLANIALDMKPFKLQNLEIGYKRELQNFNADLLDREIIQNHYYANYNISTNFNLGWFTQFFHTAQNDENKRNLLFTSLYYNILKKPALKAGVNFQYITFKNQVPTIYFSPEKFKAYEIFIDLLRSEESVKNKKIFYGLNAATGIQFIEESPKQSTYRLQGKFGYKFNDRLVANIYGTHSNIASVTAAGFTFTEIGIRIKWDITKLPIFHKKLESLKL